ncbi:MAG: nitrite/sulfite reductase [Chlamydiota bacterium]|nr:nitrite/sulfite reductase [Chlamydiota bacterium]
MKKGILKDVEKAEIERFILEMEQFEKGKKTDSEFTRFRLENGIYGIRDKEREHMVRIKIPYGQLDSDQLEVVADIVEKYTPNKLAHITTRQDIQIHNVQREHVPEIMTLLNECGLTTREACGNTVRNITACHFSGVAPGEVFDVTSYADILFRFLFRNPICQSMPRKFKIAFEGCTEDHARITIHDLGFVAKLKKQGTIHERGFQTYIGGGLGSMPKSAFLLEEFTPLELVIPTAEAVIRIHDRFSNREDRNRARIKFFIKKIGEEEARKLILNERDAVLATQSGRMMLACTEMLNLPLEKEAPLVEIPQGITDLSSQQEEDYKRWLRTNTFQQKQKGHYSVTIRCLLGDIDPDQMRQVAGIARRYCDGRMRTVITQNLIMNWVPERALPFVYHDLLEAGLEVHSADRIADITRCPGADTCKIAITRSKGLARELTPVFSNGLGSNEALQDIKIKISGCFNSCGQHHIADIGLYGLGKRVNGRDVPHYQILLGGGSKEGLSIFGKPVSMIPAKNAPKAVQSILQYYLDNMEESEKFPEFVHRMGPAKFRDLLKALSTIPSPDEDPAFFEDWGAPGVPFKISVGTGECAQ